MTAVANDSEILSRILVAGVLPHDGTVYQIESPIAEPIGAKDAAQLIQFLQACVQLLEAKPARVKANAQAKPKGYRVGSGQRHVVCQNVCDACRIAIEHRLIQFDREQRQYISEVWAYASRELAKNLTAQNADNNRN